MKAELTAVAIVLVLILVAMLYAIGEYLWKNRRR